MAGEAGALGGFQIHSNRLPCASPGPLAPPGGRGSRLQSRKPACFCVLFLTPPSQQLGPVLFLGYPVVGPLQGAGLDGSALKTRREAPRTESFDLPEGVMEIPACLGQLLLTEMKRPLGPAAPCLALRPGCSCSSMDFSAPALSPGFPSCTGVHLPLSCVWWGREGGGSRGFVGCFLFCFILLIGAYSGSTFDSGISLLTTVGRICQLPLSKSF